MVEINNLSDERTNDRINQDFSNLDKQILDKIRMNKYITIDELTKALKMSTSTINRPLKTLTTINAITRVGSKKTAIGKLIFKHHYIFLKPTSSFVPFKNIKFQNKIFHSNLKQFILLRHK